MKPPVFDYLVPDWPAPKNIQAVITLRSSGNSRAPYDHFNLASHVGDNPQQVALNRQQLIQQLGLQSQPLWLNQVHGTEVVEGAVNDSVPNADGSFSHNIHQACVILTADCLPILFCNQQGTKVAAVHAGWRGLCGGIIGSAIKRFDKNDTLLAYLGPAISAEHFEVGPEVREQFLASAMSGEHRKNIEQGFASAGSESYLADLYALARAELQHYSVKQIYGGSFCSFSQSQQFYSYRRENKCGRNASLIWLKS